MRTQTRAHKRVRKEHGRTHTHAHVHDLFYVTRFAFACAWVCMCLRVRQRFLVVRAGVLRVCLFMCVLCMCVVVLVVVFVFVCVGVRALHWGLWCVVCEWCGVCVCGVFCLPCFLRCCRAALPSWPAFRAGSSWSVIVALAAWSRFCSERCCCHARWRVDLPAPHFRRSCCARGSSRKKMCLRCFICCAWVKCACVVFRVARV